MTKITRIAFFVVATLLTTTAIRAADEEKVDPASAEATLLGHARQLTFDGKRSGEGYFNADGTKMVFQSERQDDNPFYQIYVLDLETGDTERVSPGYGKTTCAWIHPDGKRVMFASTQEDPEAKAKQTAELEFRASGKQRRYSWDYDEHFDIIEYNADTKRYRNLTHTLGYDAEGSYSPDGKLIAFASNRAGYTEKLSAEDAATFERDKSYMMDIYLMNADGSNVRRLTDVKGYDGGPFFSPDGKRICWRRFTPDGLLAEVYTMNLDGSDVRQITKLNAMSWAPYYHPSGKYLIFATNKHGFANFELYMVDAMGEHEPVRVTYTPGFDGLPVFSPDGKKLAWTTNRTPKKQSQIYIADWNDKEATKLLGLDGDAVANQGDASTKDALHAAMKNLLKEGLTTPFGAAPAIDATDLRQIIAVLASDPLEGRLTGTPGEQMATEYVAEAFKHYGLEPAGDDGGYFMPFTFTSGVKLGEGNTLAMKREGAADVSYKADDQWRPMAFSQVGKVDPTEITFAGYGIVAPGDKTGDEYDSYVHSDVKGKWVMVLRYQPENIDKDRRTELARYAALRHKAMIARDKGAAGIIVVSGPNSKVNDQLVPLQFDTSLAGTSIAAISVTDEVASAWLAASGKDLKALQDTLDKGEMVMSFDLKGVKLGANVDILKEKRTGRNVLARLNAGDAPSKEVVIVGGHVDHLGHGASGSRARKDEENKIHYGADDNASGTASMLEIAQYMADAKRSGKLKLKRDVIFAAWSGEELGLLGSSAFVDKMIKPAHGGGHEHAAAAHEAPHGEAKDDAKDAPHGDAKPASGEHAHGAAAKEREIAAYVNMDMVGRYRDKLIVQGLGSSDAWSSMIERANVPVGLNIVTQADAYLPTDSTPFYTHGVPILAAFTGSHDEYHTPRDTPDLLNYDDMARVAKFVYLITRSLTMADTQPDYIAMKRPTAGRGGGLRAYLGTIPDYAQGDLKGVKLSGVAKDGPADKAGLRTGDIIVEFNGKKVENIYDYTYAIGDVKIGVETTVTVQRDGKDVKLKITPGSRE
ncbi:MAG: M28 family peptidase [Phycisphaera sp.]|nr:M28 family peptidase [Phycisphaera sp.]